MTSKIKQEQITPERLAELVECGPEEWSRAGVDAMYRDLITTLRWALQPEPECHNRSKDTGEACGESALLPLQIVVHTFDCPVTAHRNHRAALLRVIEDDDHA